MTSTIYSMLKRPIVTEKTNALRDGMNQYVFEVAPRANKTQIREAVEKLFSVRVLSVHTSVVRGKMKRLRKTLGKQPNWKKAIVTLRDGDSIEFFEGA